jgi:hypothetical protein
MKIQLTRDQLVPASKPLTNPKILTEPRSELRDHIAPDWQLRLHAAPSSTHRFSISGIATRTEWDKKRNCIMKAKVMVALLLSIVTASQPAFTTVRSQLPHDEPPHVAMVGVSAHDAHVLADIVAIPPVLPRGPRDLLRDYELEMASIAAQLSMDLGAISDAVRTGQISSEQGEYVVGKRYQFAMMRFQLFGALHGGGYRPNAGPHFSH